MKTKVTTYLLLFFSLITYAQETYVPDDNFEQYLIDRGYDTVLDDYVTTANISGITDLYISSENIYDLTGIEDFVALESLDCSYNYLSILDFSNNTQLTYLYCSNSRIGELNISQNALLTTLDCNNNSLWVLDVSHNLALKHLTCSNNSMSTLALGNNSALMYLSCTGNNLSNLDVSQCSALENLYCYANGINSLDVTQNPALRALYCYQNYMEDLDLSHNNQLVDFDSSDCYNLTYLNIKNGNNTAINSFNVTNTNLSCIQVDDTAYSTTYWTNIDASSSFSEDCNYPTYVPDDNFEQALIDLNYDTVLDNYVTTANISGVASLNVQSMDIADLTGIEGFVALTSLNCSDNLLTSLDVTKNSALNDLDCSNNQLTSLNVKNGNNVNITDFDTNSNPDLTCIEVDDAVYSTTNWTNIDTQTSFSENCGEVVVEAKAYLQGAFLNPRVGETSLMRDDLRANSLLPTTSPYPDNAPLVGTPFIAIGADAIVDWVWVELRDDTDNTMIIDSKSALLQRDGDIVDVDGVSPLVFEKSAKYYNVVVNHRNHLGIMTDTRMPFPKGKLIDFKASAASSFGANSQVDMNGVFALWAGDVNGNNQSRYLGPSNDSATIKTIVLNAPGNASSSNYYPYANYNTGDINLDGVVRYLGPGNDKGLLKTIITNHPDNPSSNYYPISQQIPN